MQATYKKIDNADIEIVLPMMQDFYAIDGYPIDPELSRGLLLEFIANEQLGQAWLILLDNEIAGYIVLTLVFSFEYGGRIAFLDELYLKETLRGKGIGRAALDFIKSQAEILKLRLIYLEIEPHNEKARRLYFSSGFETHKRNLMYYKTSKD